jgi:CRP-like cAMP-binding protein
MFDLDQLKKVAIAIRSPKNTQVIKEGADMPYSMFIILSGSVRVIKDYDTAHPKVVANLEKGDFFGEMSLFLKEPRSASVVTSEETVLLEINQSNFYEMIEVNPEILYSIVRTLCLRINNLNDRVRAARFSQ